MNSSANIYNKYFRSANARDLSKIYSKIVVPVPRRIVPNLNSYVVGTIDSMFSLFFHGYLGQPKVDGWNRTGPISN